jgi:hypothetical protein
MPFLPKTPNKVFHVTISGAHPDACIQDHSQGFNDKGDMGNETSSNNSPLYSSVYAQSLNIAAVWALNTVERAGVTFTEWQKTFKDTKNPNQNINLTLRKNPEPSTSELSARGQQKTNACR